MRMGVFSARAESPAQLPHMDALLTALVIAPATYSRNRFFDMYSHPSAKRIHRRALHLRALVLQLLQVLASEGAKAGFTSSMEPSGELVISFRVPALGLRRTARLDAMEASLFRFTLMRGVQGLPSASEAVKAILENMGGDLSVDRQKIEGALSSLSPVGAMF